MLRDIPCLTKINDHEFLSKSSGLTLTSLEGYKLIKGGEVIFETSDRHEFWTVFAEKWLGIVACEIGMGFHPDNSASCYEPPLQGDLAREYDNMLDFCCQLLNKDDRDVYSIAMQAWEDGGIIEPRKP